MISYLLPGMFGFALGGAGCVCFILNTVCPWFLSKQVNGPIQDHANRHFGAWVLGGAIAGAVLGAVLGLLTYPGWS